MKKITKYIAPALLGLGVILIVVGLLLPGNKKEVTFTIVFDSDGGTTVESQTVKKGEKATVPNQPTKESYVFVRWDNGTKEYDFSTPVESDLNLKAVWQTEEKLPTYKITLVINGVTKEVDVTSNKQIDLSSLGLEEKDGYTIKWYVNGEEYDMTTPVTSDMKIEGKYVKETTFTIKFNSDGGTKVANQTLKKGEKVTEPTDVTKEGFILSGWYLNKTKYDFDSEVTKSITLVAKWEEDPTVTRYTVKFDSNGGSKVSDQRVIENKTASAPKNPTKNGYKFVEWTLKDKKYDFKTKVTADITLKAVWEEDIKYTVTFNTNGGNKIDNQTVKKDEKVKKPTNPTKAGYTFVEWLLDNKTYDFNAPVTKNITLTATYKENKGSAATPTPTAKPTATSTPAPTTAPTAVPTAKPTASPTPVPDKYTVTATQADNMASPDSVLKVYKNGSQVQFRCIKFTDNVIVDGSKTCQSSARSSMVAQTNDIKNEKEFIVILSDGSSVRATKN